MLGQWVITATHRQNRTFLPPADFCPLCPTRPGAFPTEVPREDYEIVVFENLFPSLRADPGDPAVEGEEFSPVRPAQGVCEVVLYSPDHNSTLADAPVRQIDRLVRVWEDRYRELGALDYVDYVHIFENKGKEIGVTILHPHGQIYAYPFVPPRMLSRRENFDRWLRENGSCLLCDVLAREMEDERRLVASNEYFAAYVPFYARYPYEVHILPLDHAVRLGRMEREQVRSLALILKTVMVKYDRLWGFSMPYIMNLFPEPTDGREDPGWHFHIEFYPPYRTAQKLKYLAGAESGADAFINDTLPETTAAELRAVEVTPE